MITVIFCLVGCTHIIHRIALIGVARLRNFTCPTGAPEPALGMPGMHRLCHSVPGSVIKTLLLQVILLCFACWQLALIGVAQFHMSAESARASVWNARHAETLVRVTNQDSSVARLLYCSALPAGNTRDL